MKPRCPSCAKIHLATEPCMAGVVLVCGGRDYDDCAFVWECLDRVADRVTITAIRHGAARGADSLADQWAKRRGYAVQPFPVTSADWNAKGKAAGHLRNTAMLDAGNVVCVVAFPGGRGTENMIRQAQERGVPVLRCARRPTSASP